MDGFGGRRRQRKFIEEHLGQGVTNQHENRLGRPAWADGPGTFSSWFGPGSLPDAFWSILDFLPYACGPLTSSSPRFRHSSLSRKLQHPLFKSLVFYSFMLQSLGHLDSCSSCVFTCVGLHDLLLKCMMNLSRKSPFKR
jgi:hypothetical protein